MPVTTFAPIAGGGINQQPITSFNYRTVGVNIDITPRLHHDDQVTLALKVSLSNLSPEPVSAACRHSAIVRLRRRSGSRMERRTCWPGLIRDEERTSLAGVPRLERSAGPRSAVRVQPQGFDADGHHPDVDAARREDPGSERGRSAAVPLGRDLGSPLSELPAPAPPRDREEGADLPGAGPTTTAVPRAQPAPAPDVPTAARGQAAGHTGAGAAAQEAGWWQLVGPRDSLLVLPSSSLL